MERADSTKLSPGVHTCVVAREESICLCDVYLGKAEAGVVHSAGGGGAHELPGVYVTLWPFCGERPFLVPQVQRMKVFLGRQELCCGKEME